MKRIYLADILQCVVALSALVLPAMSYSEHPIEIERLSATGKHYEALLAFQRIPDRQMNPEARLAAARSAWALSLPQMAIEQFDRALQNKRLGKAKRAQAYLSRAIIEFQEERYRIAPIFAEKATKSITDASPLRARAWMIWGESLLEEGSYAAAREKLSKALKEADPEIRPDLEYRLGICAAELGEHETARKHFEQVPLSHPRSSASIRKLAELAIDNHEFDKAQFWLKKARDEYSEDFLDSWVDFGLYRSAFSLGNVDKAREQKRYAEGKYPPSDEWLTLLLAEAEGSEWKASLKSDSSKTQKVKSKVSTETVSVQSTEKKSEKERK